MRLATLSSADCPHRGAARRAAAASALTRAAPAGGRRHGARPRPAGWGPHCAGFAGAAARRVQACAVAADPAHQQPSSKASRWRVMGTSAVPSKRAGQLTGWAAACAAAQCCCQRGWASPTQGVVRPLYQWRTARPHAYSQSALNCADDDDALFGAGPAHGAAPLKARLGHDNFLLDHLGDGFDLLYFSAAAAGPVASGQWPVRTNPGRCRRPPAPALRRAAQRRGLSAAA